MHTTKADWHFTAIYSNTERAHKLEKVFDWVVIFFYDSHYQEGQHTVVTETHGSNTGQRVVRGREYECRVYYETPKLLYEAFTRVYGKNMRFHRAIDLGCGSGLAGLEFQSNIDQLDGVDLSSEMLKNARKKGIYNHLYTADIVDWLNAGDDKYDLFIATDVLIYIGHLTSLFFAVKKRASKGAYFLFSIESHDDKDFELQRSGRYTQSEAYIRSLAQTHKLKVVRCRSAPLRKENEEWVNGKLFILKNVMEA